MSKILWNHSKSSQPVVPLLYLATLLKRNSDADNFLRISRNFQEHVFCRISFCIIAISQRLLTVKVLENLSIPCAFNTCRTYVLFCFIIFQDATVNSKSVNSFMTEVAIIYLLCKSMDWFLYDRDLRHERVKMKQSTGTTWI